MLYDCRLIFLLSVYFKRIVIPLLSALPLWFRCMQCLRNYFNTHQSIPHLANACKYALSHSVVLFGVFHSTFHDPHGIHSMSTYKAMWLLSLCFNSLYTFFWDIYFDWGLCHIRRYKGLREVTLYPSWCYYVSIVADFFLRFAWTLTLIPQGEDSPVSPEFVLVNNY